MRHGRRTLRHGPPPRVGAVPLSRAAQREPLARRWAAANVRAPAVVGGTVCSLSVRKCVGIGFALREYGKRCVTFDYVIDQGIHPCDERVGHVQVESRCKEVMLEGNRAPSVVDATGRLIHDREIDAELLSRDLFDVVPG